MYVDQTQQRSDLAKSVPGSRINPDYGMSVGRGQFVFNTGEWTALRQSVHLNSFIGASPVQDGYVKVEVNEKEAFTLDKLILRTSNFTVSGIDFATFFGGNSDEYKTPVEQFSYFKDFKIIKS
jgi:hypothetical protein